MFLVISIAEMWRARRDSNPQPSDPKSDFAYALGCARLLSVNVFKAFSRGVCPEYASIAVRFHQFDHT